MHDIEKLMNRAFREFVEECRYRDWILKTFEQWVDGVRWHCVIIRLRDAEKIEALVPMVRGCFKLGLRLEGDKHVPDISHDMNDGSACALFDFGHGYPFTKSLESAMFASTAIRTADIRSLRWIRYLQTSDND